jgi:hypothetical protein
MIDDEWGNLGNSENFENTSGRKISWTKSRKKLQAKNHAKIVESEKWKQSNSESNRKKAKDPEWIKSVTDGVQNAYDNNLEYKKSQVERLQSEEFNKKRLEGFHKYHEENAEEFSQKISIARRNGKGMREIVTPYGEFKCIAEFNDYINKAETFFFNKKKKNALPHLYYYKDEGPGEPTYETVFHSPYGIAGNKHRYRLIETKAIEANDQVYLSHKCKNSWWHKMCKLYPDQYYETREIRREWDLEP